MEEPTRDIVKTQGNDTPRRTDGETELAAPPREHGPMPDPEGYTLDRLVRYLFIAAGLGAVAWTVWYFMGLVLYILAGCVIAYLLQPFVDRLQSFGLARVPAILVTFFLLFLVFYFAITSVVPFFTRQVGDVTQLVTLDSLIEVAQFLENRIQEVVPIEQGVIVEGVRQTAESLVRGDLVGGEDVAQTISSLVSVFTNILWAVVIVPFVTFFVLKDGTQIRRSLLHLVPNRYFEITLAIMEKVETNIGRYLQGLVVQCFSVGLVATVLLYIAGLEDALAVGIFVGLANTIPYFGPLLGYIVGSLFAIVQTGDFSLVLPVIIAMAFTQLADNVLFQPLIFSRAARAHPLVILFVVLMGAQLAGLIGMLVAIPLATTVLVVMQQVVWSFRNYRVLRGTST